MATGKKEVSWEFIHETSGKKYFLVKKSEAEYFVFRTPSSSSEEAKSAYTLVNWEGEIVPWGGVPAKVRNWLSRKQISPSLEKPGSLTSKS